MADCRFRRHLSSLGMVAIARASYRWVYFGAADLREQSLVFPSPGRRRRYYQSSSCSKHDNGDIHNCNFTTCKRTQSERESALDPAFTTTVAVLASSVGRNEACHRRSSRFIKARDPACRRDRISGHYGDHHHSRGRMVDAPRTRCVEQGSKRTTAI